MNVITIDVYDTLLTRKVGIPCHIFLLTGIQIEKQLNLEIEPEIFAKARRLAEQELVAQRKISADIYEIYRRLAKQLATSQEISGAFADIELKVELSTDNQC